MQDQWIDICGHRIKMRNSETKGPHRKYTVTDAIHVNNLKKHVYNIVMESVQYPDYCVGLVTNFINDSNLDKKRNKKLLLEIAMQLMTEASDIDYDINSQDNGKYEQNVNNNMNPNELQLLEKKINQINEWSENGENMRNLSFIQDMVNCYPKSIKIAKKQTNQRVKSTTSLVLQTFQTKLKCEEQIQTLEHQLEDFTFQYENFVSELAEKEKTMKQLETSIRNQLTEYGTIVTSHAQLRQRAEKVQGSLAEMKKPLEIKKIIVEKCDTLLKKYNQFNANTKNHICEMEKKRDQGFDLFESKWLDWGYIDIVFWFKVKLGYYKMDIERNTDNDNDDNDDNDHKQNDIENDLLSINFENIYKNLESQRIRGKFLSLINRNDLRGLGFEIFEHQCILQNSIELLVEKHPIPKVSAKFDYGNEIEGVNAVDTNKGGIDAKYICPITKKIMKSPVIAYDGCVYEKEAIIEYLTKNKTTPMQGQERALKSKEKVQQMIEFLVPHYELQMEMKKKSLIMQD